MIEEIDSKSPQNEADIRSRESRGGLARDIQIDEA